MSHAEITGLYRYPVKGLSPEPLQAVPLAVGQTLPTDRRYASRTAPAASIRQHQPGGQKPTT
jgi:uncharacterized protein